MPINTVHTNKQGKIKKKNNCNQSNKLFYGTNCSLNVEIALTELLVTKLILYLVIMFVFSTFYTLFAKQKL